MTFFFNDPVRKIVTPLPEEFYRRKITDPDKISLSKRIKSVRLHAQPLTNQPIAHQHQDSTAYSENNDESTEIEPYARELMSSPVISTSTNTLIKDIWKQFIHHSVHHIGLISDSGMLAGVASYRSIFEFIMSEEHNKQSWRGVTAEILTKNILITASLEATLSNLALVMLTHQISAIPIVSSTHISGEENRRLEGIVTTSDILKACLHKKGLNIQA